MDGRVSDQRERSGFVGASPQDFSAEEIAEPSLVAFR
jgi:hypothetical protein